MKLAFSRQRNLHYGTHVIRILWDFSSYFSLFFFLSSSSCSSSLNSLLPSSSSFFLFLAFVGLSNSSFVYIEKTSDVYVIKAMPRSHLCVDWVPVDVHHLGMHVSIKIWYYIILSNLYTLKFKTMFYMFCNFCYIYLAHHILYSFCLFTFSALSSVICVVTLYIFSPYIYYVNCIYSVLRLNTRKNMKRCCLLAPRLARVCLGH